MRQEVTKMGGSVKRSNATLRVSHEELQPELFTASVGIAPSHAHAKGDPISPRVSSQRKHGMWMLDSEDNPLSQLDEKIQSILKRLPDPGTWLAATRGFDVDLYCSVLVAGDCAGFNLSLETIRLLSELQIPIGIEIWTDDDDAPPSA